jgi:hypothetical protein
MGLFPPQMGRESSGSLPVSSGAFATGPNAKEKLKTRVLERAREPMFHDFGPTLLTEHRSRGFVDRPRCFGHLEAMNDRGRSLVSFREKAPSPTPA